MTTRQIQDLLHYLGYDLTPDGLWGPETEDAVREFQKDYGGIAVDGNPGRATQKALKDSVAYDKFRPPNNVESETTPAPSETETIDLGSFWGDITNFTPEEFKCKCGGKYCNGYPAAPQEAMVRLAQAARDHFGKPATVISGLRCAQHNANEGGVANSQHMYGEACDLRIEGVSAAKLLDFFLAQPGVRYAYAINATNTHFDIPQGER